MLLNQKNHFKFKKKQKALKMSLLNKIKESIWSEEDKCKEKLYEKVRILMSFDFK